MTEATEQRFRPDVSNLLIAKAAQYSALSAEDKKALLSIPSRTRMLRAGEEIVSQGERPTTAVLVTRGMLARYHMLATGERQYLSFHIRGDLPDIQSLFLTVMDHSLCAMSSAEAALLPHEHLKRVFATNPLVGFALWRITLVDAAIFRQAITNIGSRSSIARLAHFFCEQAYRAREAGLSDGVIVDLPINQNELGQALGLSLVSMNRNIQKLRKENLIALRNEKLEIINWRALVEVAGFDPTYLHAAKQW